MAKPKKQLYKITIPKSVEFVVASSPSELRAELRKAFNLYHWLPEGERGVKPKLVKSCKEIPRIWKGAIPFGARNRGNVEIIEDFCATPKKRRKKK